MDPPRKKPRSDQPECENIGASAGASVSTEVGPIVAAAHLNPNTAAECPLRNVMQMFGRYHDLRQSGALVWCRLCGRFGEERIRPDGLGGDGKVALKGAKYRAHTQLNLLRSGLHPRTKMPLPVDIAFLR